MRKKRVLILSEGFGSGHTQAGYALAAGMKKKNPHIQTKVLELGSFLNPTVAPWILSAYRLTLSTNPALVGMFYRKQYHKPLSRLTALALHKIFYHHAAHVIRQLRPDLIVCTHPIPSAIISRLKTAGLNVPLCTVITDYDAHGAWISQEVDHYLVSTSAVEQLVMQRGVNRQNIHVTGIPVHPKFWTGEDKSSARRDMNLKDMPTVLVMGGGWGLLSNKQLFEDLTKWKEQVQFVFCMGNNEKLLSKIQNNPAFTHPNITVIGQTKEINKWMDASDLLITKPGGMTCTEGLAKGLPMLFFESIPGQEEKNCEYFVSSGLGNVLDSSEVLDQWLNRLTNSTPVQTKADAGSRVVHQAGYCPDRCATELLELLNYPFEQKVVHTSAHRIPVAF